MKRIFYILLLSSAISGCSQMPEFLRPKADIPANWRGQEMMTTTRPDLSDWWKKFDNAELAGLQDKAIKQNFDLKAAAARIDQAHAAEKAVASSFFPQADVTASSSIGQSKTGGGETTSTRKGSAGLDISYELDMFGKNRAGVESAKADVASSIYARDALALLLSSDVAKTYAAVLALKGRVYVAQQSEENLRHTLKIIEAQVKEGAASALELEQQKTALSNAVAQEAQLNETLAQTQNALAVLVGDTPQDFTMTGKSLSEVTVPDIAAGQPSTLLERRPDIRKAEADLIAANADIGVARAAFFPTITLGLGGSLASSPLGNPPARAVDIISGLTFPLFHAGELEANEEKATAKQTELAENYRQSILVSFQEVEDALAALKGANVRQEAYSKALISAQKAYDLAGRRYKEGAVGYIVYLEAERSLLAAKNNLIGANLDRFNAAVDLYKAQGGGWSG